MIGEDPAVVALLDWIRGAIKPNEQLWEAALLPETSWAIDVIRGMNADDIWRSQPSVRTVVGFTARNISRLGLHTFERAGDDRTRTRTDPVARLLAAPNPQQTTYELFNGLISDFALNDKAYLLAVPDSKRSSGWLLRNIPARWVTVSRANAWEVLEYNVTIPGRRAQKVLAEFILKFHGWNPNDVRSGVSPLESLKDTMAEQISAKKYRKQIWDSGARAGSVITRPAGNWSDEARARFIQHLKDAFAKDGTRAGGALVLEDGMTMNKIRFSAHEDQFVEAARLSLETVAMVYYINPTMIGMLDNANYSNMKEFRKALYGETLGAPIQMMQERINAFLVPKVTKADVFVEFNVESQMRGSFEEQAAVLSTSTGAPWLTRNEVRAMQNRPPIEGGDELIVPLNVLTGGQASPQDSAPGQASALTVNAIEQIIRRVTGDGKAHAPAVKDRKSDVRFKAEASDGSAEAMTELLAKFFKRQGDVVQHNLGAKADGWWDEERWNTELAADLYKLALKVSGQVGRDTLGAVGLEPDQYDVDQTLHYLEAVAANTAGRLNSVTKQQLDEALASAEGLDAVAHVFEKAEGARADEAGPSIVTGLAGFAAVESLKQNGLQDEATKTWLVTSRNPRPSHAQMNGETVALSENFSNGAAWPGDMQLDVDEIAGCMCALEMYIP